MLHVAVGGSSFGSTTDIGRPATTTGVSISPATGAYAPATPTTLATLTKDSYGIMLVLHGNRTTSASRNTVFRLSIRYPGSATFVTLVDNLLCGNAAPFTAATASGGVYYYLPLFLPAGSVIGGQGRSSVTTSFRTLAYFYYDPPNPSLIRKGSFTENFGYDGTRAGFPVTAGTTNESTYQLIGTTSKRLWSWQVGWQIGTGDTAHQNATIAVDVAYGNGVTFYEFITDYLLYTSSQESLNNPPFTLGTEMDIPAGINLYVRARSSGNLDANTTVMVYGTGG